MFDAEYIFKLDSDVQVQTDGGTVTANNLIGRSYSESDYIFGEYTPTYIVKGQTGDFEVRQDDVVEIIAINDL